MTTTTPETLSTTAPTPDGEISISDTDYKDFEAILGDFSSADFLDFKDYEFQGFRIEVLMKVFLDQVKYKQGNQEQRKRIRQAIADVIWIVLHRGSLLDKIMKRSTDVGRAKMRDLVSLLGLTLVERTKGNPIGAKVITMPRLSLLFSDVTFKMYILKKARAITNEEDFEAKPYYYMGWASICPNHPAFNDWFEQHVIWAKKAGKVFSPNKSAVEYEALDKVQENILKTQRSSTFFSEDQRLMFHNHWRQTYPDTVGSDKVTAIDTAMAKMALARAAKKTK